MIFEREKKSRRKSPSVASHEFTAEFNDSMAQILLSLRISKHKKTLRGKYGMIKHRKTLRGEQGLVHIYHKIPVCAAEQNARMMPD